MPAGNIRYGDGQMKIPVVLSWSGGKDSAMALHELSRHADYEVVGLLTTVSDEYKRISHHGVREELLDLQAAAIGLALDKIYLPSSNSHPCTNAVYEQIMSEAMQRYLRKGVATVGFGDLFLENLRAWRERNLATIGMQALFPLWKRPTRELVREIIALGFKGYLSCVEGKVGPGFAGRSLDESLLTDLPSTVDPCGENGEFHTFVYAGPIFSRPVDIQVGQTVQRDGRYYADLLPAHIVRQSIITASAIPPVR
jgi:uncharacterized protein (TIGR00290 family)